jgi:hypothetical protein
MISSIFPQFCFNKWYFSIDKYCYMYLAVYNRIVLNTYDDIYVEINNINRFCISILSPCLLSSQFTQNIQEKWRMAG